MSLPPANTYSDNPESQPPIPKIQKRCLNEINAQLTPGLIHEVNNVLTGIYFNIENCRDGIDASHPAFETIHEIQVGVERIKLVLGRITQIHLNAADREQNYHELQALVSGQLDLLRILFPKTARIILSASEEPLFVHASEESFRVGLLSLASCLKGLYPDGKIEIPLTVLSSADLIRISGEDGFLDCVGVCFTVPCVALSVAEIDDFHSLSVTSDISLASAEAIICANGGRLLFFKGSEPHTSQVAMIFPQCQLTSQH